MSFDLVMRTLGVVTCLYTVAYFVTSMSVAALNAVTFSSGPHVRRDGLRDRRPAPGEADARPGPRHGAPVGGGFVPAELSGRA